MPIRRRPPNRSMLFWVSFHTLATIAPTVRQAIRINSHTAVFDHATASQATVSSKATVCPAWWRAHRTATTVGPWLGQFTRGASASSTTCTVPQSRPRHHQRLALGVFLLELLQLDVFNHGALIDTQQPTP